MESKKGRLFLIPSFYLLVSLIVTFPFILKVANEIPGDATRLDQAVRIWQLWWMKFSVTNHLSPLSSEYLYYPFGIDLLAYFGGYFDLLFFIPFTLLLPPLLANNLLLLAGLVFSGISGYILASYITDNRGAGLLGGLIIMVNPYIYTHSLMSHTEQVEAGALLLAIYFFHRSLDSPGRGRNILFTGLFVLFAYLCYMAYALFALIYFTVFVLLHPLFEYLKTRVNLYPRYLKTFILTIVVSMTLLTPLILLFSKSYFSFEYSKHFLFPGGIRTEGMTLPWEENGSSPLDYLADPDLEWRTVQSSVILTDLLDPAHLLYLIIPGALGITALFSRDKRRGPYLLILLLALLSLIFSFGPFLRRGESFDSMIPVPLPYLILRKAIPFFSRFHHPERFLVLFYSLLGIAAGGGVLMITGRLKGGYRRFFLPCLMAVYLIIFKILHPPFSTTPLPACPEFYTAIRGEGDIKIIEIPFSFSRSNLSLFPFYYQFCHEKKILDGIPHLYNISEEYKEFLSSSPILMTLLNICNGIPPAGKGDPGALQSDLKRLKSLGFKYIVLHPYLTDLQIRNLIEDFLFRNLGPPLERGRGEIVVWRIE